MIKNVCVLMSLIFTASVGFSADKPAEKTLQDLEALTKNVTVQNNKFSEDLTALSAKQKSTADAIQKAQKEYDTAYAKWKASGGSEGVFGMGSNLGGKDERNNMATAKSRLDDLKQEKDEAVTKADKLKADQQKLLQESNKDVYALKEKNKALTTAITTQGLLTDFATFQAKVGDTDRALDMLSNQYDKALLGAYLKDKIGLLLNSQTMCEAVSRCTSKGRKEVSAESVQKTIFPGTENSSRKGNLYDKSHGTSSDSSNGAQ